MPKSVLLCNLRDATSRSVLADDELSSAALHGSTKSCQRQFDHIIGDLLFSASPATVVRSENVQFVVRIGDVVRGVVTTVQFGDDTSPVDNVTLSSDNAIRDDLSARYRYRAVVSHRYSCAGRYHAQLTVYTHLHTCSLNLVYIH